MNIDDYGTFFRSERGGWRISFDGRILPWSADNGYVPSSVLRSCGTTVCDVSENKVSVSVRIRPLALRIPIIIFDKNKCGGDRELQNVLLWTLIVDSLSGAKFHIGGWEHIFELVSIRYGSSPQTAASEKLLKKLNITANK